MRLTRTDALLDDLDRVLRLPHASTEFQVIQARRLVRDLLKLRKALRRKRAYDAAVRDYADAAMKAKGRTDPCDDAAAECGS